MSIRVPVLICSTCCNWDEGKSQCKVGIVILRFSDECRWWGIPVSEGFFCCRVSEIGPFGRILGGGN